MVNAQGRFNDEKFRKLVALFDSPNTNEAENAFRLALEELSRNQLTFTDQLLNNAELERAQDECAEAQVKLAELFERYAKREAEADEMEATLDRLHEHIAELEARATDARESLQPEGVQSAATPSTFFGADEPEASDDSEALPHRGESLYLPAWITAFWSGLITSLLYYIGASLRAGHPLATLADWNATYWYEFVVVLLLTAVLTYSSHDTINNAVGPNINRLKAVSGSPRMMLFALVGLLVAWALAYCVWAGFTNQPLSDGVRLVVVLFIIGAWWSMSGRRHLQNFGGRGVVLNALLTITLLYVCVVGPVDGGASDAYLIKSSVVGALLTFPLCSDWLAVWILDSERRFRWIAGIGVVFTLMTAIVLYSALNAPAPNSRPQAQRAAPVDPFSEWKAQPLHAKHKGRVRK